MTAPIQSRPTSHEYAKALNAITEFKADAEKMLDSLQIDGTKLISDIGNNLIASDRGSKLLSDFGNKLAASETGTKLICGMVSTSIIGSVLYGACGALILNASTHYMVSPITAAVACGIQHIASNFLESRINSVANLILSTLIGSALAVAMEYSITFTGCAFCSLTGPAGLFAAMLAAACVGQVLQSIGNTLSKL